MMVCGTEYVIVLAVILFDGTGDHVQFGSVDNESEVTIIFQPSDDWFLEVLGAPHKW